jgi:hypothetical protein
VLKPRILKKLPKSEISKLKYGILRRIPEFLKALDIKSGDLATESCIRHCGISP